MTGAIGLGVYWIIFWVLRTLRYQWRSCGTASEVREVDAWKGLCPLHSRKPFKKGLTLNLYLPGSESRVEYTRVNVLNQSMPLFMSFHHAHFIFVRTQRTLSTSKSPKTRQQRGFFTGNRRFFEKTVDKPGGNPLYY